MAKDTEDIMAITHDDGLQLFKNLVRTSQKIGMYGQS